MGGNDGDCATYRGRVISVNEIRVEARIFTVDSQAPASSQGAIWMGGAAPVVDAKGNVWVSAGNGSVNNPQSGLRRQRLGARTHRDLADCEQYFAPSTLARRQRSRPRHVHRRRCCSPTDRS